MQRCRRRVVLSPPCERPLPDDGSNQPSAAHVVTFSKLGSGLATVRQVIISRLPFVIMPLHGPQDMPSQFILWDTGMCSQPTFIGNRVGPHDGLLVRSFGTRIKKDCRK